MNKNLRSSISSDFLDKGTLMRQTDILNAIDKERLEKWLSTLVIPWIVRPSYFIQMGFPESFVRQYLKKHRNAVRINGEIVKEVRGISEADFLWGLAEAIGADTTQASRAQSVTNQTRLYVKACQAALYGFDKNEHVIDDQENLVAI